MKTVIFPDWYDFYNLKSIREKIKLIKKYYSKEDFIILLKETKKNKRLTGKRSKGEKIIVTMLNSRIFNVIWWNDGNRLGEEERFSGYPHSGTLMI